MSKRPTVFLAADHGGKNLLIYLSKKLGVWCNLLFITPSARPDDDYPVIAHALAKRVTSRPGSFGIGICRTGSGMSMVANKHSGIRAIQSWQPIIATRGRQDEDANILCLAAEKKYQQKTLIWLEPGNLSNDRQLNTKC
jgi:ribose 5-phosphate isomerase B